MVLGLILFSFPATSLQMKISSSCLRRSTSVFRRGASLCPQGSSKNPLHSSLCLLISSILHSLLKAPRGELIFGTFFYGTLCFLTYSVPVRLFSIHHFFGYLYNLLTGKAVLLKQVLYVLSRFTESIPNSHSLHRARSIFT